MEEAGRARALLADDEFKEEEVGEEVEEEEEQEVSSELEDGEEEDELGADEGGLGLGLEGVEDMHAGGFIAARGKPVTYGRRLVGAESAVAVVVPPSYIMMIIHATPVNGGVLLHLRLQHATTAAHQQHHLGSTSLSAASSSVASSTQHFEVRVEPGQREILVSVAELQRGGWMTDVLVDGLRDGEEYTFTSWWVNVHGAKAQSSRRAVTARPGCFSPLMTQCCGRGECVAGPAPSSTATASASALSTSPASSTSSAQVVTAHCRCDSGYVGLHCTSFEVVHVGENNNAANLVDSHTSCPAHFMPHLALLNKTSAASAAASTGSGAGTGANSGVSLLTPGVTKEDFEFCPFSSGGDAGTEVCCVSLEVVLQPRGMQSWALYSKFNGKYKEIVQSGFEEDLSHALSAVASKVTYVSVLVTPAPMQLLSGDKIVFNRTALAQHGAAAAGHVPPMLYAHLRLCGAADAVSGTSEALVVQLSDSTSTLRTGLVTSHLKPSHVVAVAHKDTSAKQPSPGSIGLPKAPQQHGHSSYVFSGLAPPPDDGSSYGHYPRVSPMWIIAPSVLFGVLVSIYFGLNKIVLQAWCKLSEILMTLTQNKVATAKH
jgi:hypothetical protein